MKFEEHEKKGPGESWYDVPDGPGKKRVPTPKGDRRVIGAYTDDGVQMGYLDWHGEDGGVLGLPHMIAQITVHPEYRRQGVATALFRHAQSLDPLIRHSSVRTGPGDLWAKSTGDPVPIRHLSLQRPGRRPSLVTDVTFQKVTDDIIHKIKHEAGY